MKSRNRTATSAILYIGGSSKEALKEVMRKLGNRDCTLHIVNLNDVKSEFTLRPLRLKNLLENIENSYTFIDKITIESSDKESKPISWFTHDWYYRQPKCSIIKVYLTEENYAMLLLNNTFTKMSSEESEDDPHYKWINDLDLDKEEK